MNNIEVSKYLAAANSYIKEMSRYNSELNLYSKNNINIAFMKYLMDPDMNVIHLYQDNEYAGFMIISTGTKCHPDADYHIMEAYVVPKCRNKGIMKQAVKTQFENNPGTYCLYILKDNKKTNDLFNHIFESIGYETDVVKDQFARENFNQYFVKKIV